MSTSANSIEDQTAGNRMPAAGESLEANRREARYQVICVCGGIGFPVSGSSKRIANVGRALMAAGIPYRVLHCGPTPVPLNTRRSGVHSGIPFQYTTWLKRPANRLALFLTYVWGAIGLAARLTLARLQRRRMAVYLFAMEGSLVLCAGLICKFLRIPLIQEMCEWFPAFPSMTGLTRWLYSGPIFANATGMLAISTHIQRRAREASAKSNPRLLIHHLPSIVDSQWILDAPPYVDGRSEGPVFVWCGVGYPDYVRFMVRAMALLYAQGLRCTLRTISTTYPSWTPDSIRQYAAEQGVPANAFDFVGCVDESTLAGCYKSAAALLLPMWDEERSKARVPNKLAEYMASGRPVITSAVGDLANFLQHGVNAYLGEPGSERDFADNMRAVMDNPALATRIGAAGQRTCLERMDYRYQAKSLSEFFVNCMENRLQPERSPR